MNPITIGAMIFHKISPSLIQPFLTGVRIFEFVIPKTKNIDAIPNAHILINSEFNKVQRAINKKIIKNKIPKLLLFSFFRIIIDTVS